MINERKSTVPFQASFLTGLAVLKKQKHVQYKTDVTFHIIKETELTCIFEGLIQKHH